MGREEKKEGKYKLDKEELQKTKQIYLSSLYDANSL
jgi:hypothetical protein